MLINSSVHELGKAKGLASIKWYLSAESDCITRDGITNRGKNMRILFTAVLLANLVACSSIDSIYEGSKTIVGGVVKDVTDITTGTLDTVSGVVKDVSDKTTGGKE